MMTLRKNTAGLTLIELMVTLAIIAIIAAIAFPAFQATQQRSRRPIAISFLTQAQGFMESCYSKSEPRTYAPSGGCVLPAAIAAAPAAPNTLYTIAITAADATSYALTATAVAGQLNDTNCRRLTLTNTSMKGSFDNAGIASTGCWPQ